MKEGKKGIHRINPLLDPHNTPKSLTLAGPYVNPRSFPAQGKHTERSKAHASAHKCMSGTCEQGGREACVDPSIFLHSSTHLPTHPSIHPSISASLSLCGSCKQHLLPLILACLRTFSLSLYAQNRAFFLQN